MPLGEDEQYWLDQIASALAEDDPKLAEALSATKLKSKPKVRPKRNVGPKPERKHSRPVRVMLILARPFVRLFLWFTTPIRFLLRLYRDWYAKQVKQDDKESQVNLLCAWGIWIIIGIIWFTVW